MALEARLPNPAHESPIPPAIRRQAEQAERLQRESVGQGEGEVTPGVTDPQAPPAPQPAPVQPPAPAPQPPQSELATVQGRLDAERERRQNLEGQIASLNQMVANLQTQARTAAAPPPAQLPTPKSKLVTEQEETDYGADLLAVMGKRARDEVSSEMEEMRGKIRMLEGQVGQVGEKVWKREEGDLHTELNRAVPGWVNQNSDPDFINWLQQPEPFSGLKRHDLLTRAYDLQDAGRVIRFFQGYLDEAAATGQRLPATPAPVPPYNGANGKVPLETFTAPGRAAPAPASAPPGQKPTYTRAGIAQFYTDKAAGKWRGREVDAANLEADIFRAGPEGRVIG